MKGGGEEEGRTDEREGEEGWGEKGVWKKRREGRRRRRGKE